MNLQELAGEMLGLPPSFTQRWGGGADEYALAVWLGRLYGYDVMIRRENPDDIGGKYLILVVVFTRVDEPGARRRAEWMRNPAGDPTYPPPVSWHLDGGPGFHPPGWDLAARLVVTPEVERSLIYNRNQYVQIVREKYGAPRFMARERQVPPDLPPSPLPPPPPGTIAYPDEDRTR